MLSQWSPAALGGPVLGRPHGEGLHGRGRCLVRSIWLGLHGGGGPPSGLPMPLDSGRRRGLSRRQLRAGACGSFINPELPPPFPSPGSRQEKFGFLVQRKGATWSCLLFLPFHFLFVNKV